VDSGAVTSASSPAILKEMIDGYRVSQLIYVAADLGIADLLKDGPRRCGELATATGSNPHALHRVLLALSSVGVFSRVSGDRFALNSVAECLQTGVPGSLRATARVSGSQLYPAWGYLRHTIRTGETAFDRLHGVDAWKCREQDAESARAFNDAMSEVAAHIARAVLEACDLSRFRTIVDIGGGQGTLMIAILKANPAARGILLDLASAIKDAKLLMEEAGLAERCELVSGSFLDFVPPGGDGYVLSRVIHDWNDDLALRILGNVRRVVREGQKLLIIERVVDAERTSAETALSDVNMLVMNGGRERTETEFRGLLNSAGFDLGRIVPTRSLVHIIEAVAA
jgi:hypothetical protein